MAREMENPPENCDPAGFVEVDIDTNDKPTPQCTESEGQNVSCETPASSSEEADSNNGHSKISPGARRYLGIALAGFAALQYSLSALIIKLINYHPYNLGVWRFSSMIFITLPFLIHGQFFREKSARMLHQVWPLNKTTGYLVLQAILGSNSIMFVFFGLSYLNIGDSIVISTSAPVFVTILGWMILKERCGIAPVVTAIIAMFGVAIICKPPILTGDTKLNSDTIKGVTFSFLSMVLLTFCYVLIRYLRKVHHALIQFTFAVWGLLESVAMVFILDVLKVPASWYEVGLIVTNALLAFMAQTSITLALKYEQAGMVALVRTTEVVFCYFWQTLFLHVQPDIFSLVGAVITLSCVVLAALRKTLLSLPENHQFRRRFSYLLL